MMDRLTKKLLIGTFLVFGIIICIDMDSDAGGAAPEPLFKVGYQVIDLKYCKDRQEQTLTVAVWYPTAVHSKPYNYGGPTNGNVAIDAVPFTKAGPYPLLVFSHGYGGSGLSAVFFTELLAAHGWIVACPDHHDKYSAVRIRTGHKKNFNRFGFLRHAREIGASGPDDRVKYRYRLNEMQLTLDGLLASDPFGKLIDIHRVALGGHSFGGYAALGLSGAIKQHHDSRIKAVLLFSTGAGAYLFREDELAAVKVPSMLFMGKREANQKRGSEIMADLSEKIYRNVSRPKYFIEIEKAGHFSFNNRFSNNLGSRLLSGTEKEFEIIRRYSIAFLDKYVAGKDYADKVLEYRDELLTRFVMELAPDTSKQDSKEIFCQ